MCSVSWVMTLWEPVRASWAGTLTWVSSWEGLWMCEGVAWDEL